MKCIDGTAYIKKIHITCLKTNKTKTNKGVKCQLKLYNNSIILISMNNKLMDSVIFSLITGRSKTHRLGDLRHASMYILGEPLWSWTNEFRHTEFRAYCNKPRHIINTQTKYVERPEIRFYIAAFCSEIGQLSSLWTLICSGVLRKQ